LDLFFLIEDYRQEELQENGLEKGLTWDNLDISGDIR
jgi:hypothetical protein